MRKTDIFWLSIIIISTLCYYMPNLSIDAKSIDIEKVPEDFYHFYNLKLAGAFLMTSIYSVSAFKLMSAKRLIPKLILCYMAVMESLTFIMHVIDKFYRKQIYGGYQILITFVVFAVCSGFVFRKAFKKQKSDSFDPNKHFIVNFKPKNNLGVLNYLIRDIGHLAIYYQGRLYSFARETRRIGVKYVLPQFFENKDITLRQCDQIRNPERFIGKRFNLFKFNCNHFVKYATGN